jgi:hypothetical protein
MRDGIFGESTAKYSVYAKFALLVPQRAGMRASISLGLKAYALGYARRFAFDNPLIAGVLIGRHVFSPH